MLTDADRLYIRANFRSLAELCAGRAVNPDDVRALLATGLLPRPTYVLDDGTEMFPPDYFELVDAAGGVENLRGEFERRFLAAAEAAGGPARLLIPAAILVALAVGGYLVFDRMAPKIAEEL